MCPSATEETYSSFRSLDQPEEQKHCALIQVHWQCDFGFRDRAGHRNIRGQRNPPGCPCTQSHRDYSPVLLSSPISASILCQGFPVLSSGSPFLTHTLCPQPLPTPRLDCFALALALSPSGVTISSITLGSHGCWGMEAESMECDSQRCPYTSIARISTIPCC